METEPGLTQLPEEALANFVQDPLAFVRKIIEEEAVKHLAQLKDEAELRGAINLLRRKSSEFKQFEPMILQEVATLIQNDPDGHIDPWDTLLEKAMERFKGKFRTMVSEEAQRMDGVDLPPFVEGAGSRSLPEAEPAFTREQIAKMSMDDYLRNEAAIDQALKGKRIV